MEELLKEVTLSERRRKTIDSLVQEVTSLLASVPETTDTELSDQSWMPRGVKVPLLQVPYSVKGRFRMAPPHSVKLVGSYPLGTCSKPDVNVDLAVTMPAILHPKDYLNQRYHRKRALYLTGLAHHLSSSHAFGSLRFTYHHGNHLRPLLLLTPQGKTAESSDPHKPKQLLLHLIHWEWSISPINTSDPHMWRAYQSNNQLLGFVMTAALPRLRKAVTHTNPSSCCFT
ncbi:UNVERIFIED_CONTAM: hypothetical protein FKN15_005973 [Acipenser sinensis]